MQRLVRSRDKASVRDEEAVETDGRGSMVVMPARFDGESSRGARRRTTNLDMDEVEGFHTAPDEDSQPSLDHSLSRLAIASESNPRLLSDEENDQMNAKIDKLIAAISERRQIHFAPVAETGEVDIFADHDIEGKVVGQDEYDIEQDIANSPNNFGRILRSGKGVRRIKSPSSLLDVSSRDSWTSTTDFKSSSNAWERAVAAADIRFAMEHRDIGEDAVVRDTFSSEKMETRIPFQRRVVHTISPIPLNYDKSVRSSTPSVHSNGSELDTSSPLFRKSCERLRRETYAVPPKSTFERVYSEESRFGDEWAFVSGPPDDSSAEAMESKALVGKRRAFGVFDDAENGASSRALEKPNIPPKALKDISNLRRPGYLQFNSFAKDAKTTTNRKDTVLPITASSAGFEGAPDPESRRAYINKKWPGLLQDPRRDSTPEPPKLDGVARRRNEQAIGHPIDTSHYSLSHVRTSMADSSLNVGPARQAHFDLALARLEGRALPPSRSPIQRHPDSAALFDRDILVEGGHRPLTLRGPRPANTMPHRVLWYNSG